MGKPAKMDEIRQIAKKYNLYVIADAAEAHGATYQGKNVALLADLSAYSLYLAHIISSIEGGMVVTDNSEFAEILRSLRSHGRSCKCKICTLNVQSGFCPKRFQNGQDARFIFERIGFSSKMNELEAAVGLGNLEIYNEILGKRRKNLLNLMQRFEKFEQYLITIKEEKDEKIGPHALPIIVKEGTSFSRNQLADFLEKQGIETRNLFSSMPTQCQGFSFLDYKLGDFPNAEYIGNNGLHIGVHQDLGEEHVDYIIETIEKFLSNHD
jgi:dTDP-4-amino-4,6-dideoxygalactose transaminase